MKDLKLLAILLALAVQTTAQAPAHVQTRSKLVTSAAASINLNFPSSSTPGNLIVVHLTWDKQTRDVNTVTDTKGNAYHAIGAATNWGGGSYRSQLYYAYNISAGASPLSITATLNGAVGSLYEMYISEYSGVLTTADPLDKTLINAGSGSTVTSGSVTTTASNELIYGVAIGKTVPLGVGTGFNPRSTDQDNIVEDKTGATVGSFSATFTGAGNWIAQIATFKPLITLPVTLLSFDAKQLKGNKVELDWATATESNSDHFEIEHSQNGANWTSIGQVAAAGNSATTLQYSFVDDAPYSDVTWYRLKQVDRDGTATISKIVTVHADAPAATTAHVYPNPATSYLVVENATRAVTIFSTAGQRMLVRTVPDGETKTTIDLTSLPNGAYFVKTGDESTVLVKR